MKVGDVVWFTMERYNRALERQRRSPYGKGTVTDEYVISTFIYGQTIKQIILYGETTYVELESAGAMIYDIKSLTRTATMKKEYHFNEELFKI